MYLGRSAIFAVFCIFAFASFASSQSEDHDAAIDPGTEELTVEGTVPHYEYPPNPLDTPKGPTKVFRGRWHLDFEGALFRDADTGRHFATFGTDNDLYALVSGGDSPYDWKGCFDVVLQAAIANYPAPHIYRADWLLIERVVSARKIDEVIEGICK
jgi:hypothetical protein